MEVLVEAHEEAHVGDHEEVHEDQEAHDDLGEEVYDPFLEGAFLYPYVGAFLAHQGQEVQGALEVHLAHRAPFFLVVLVAEGWSESYTETQTVQEPAL